LGAIPLQSERIPRMHAVGYMIAVQQPERPLTNMRNQLSDRWKAILVGCALVLFLWLVFGFR
jgi:hypothetical protein